MPHHGRAGSPLGSTMRAASMYVVDLPSCGAFRFESRPTETRRSDKRRHRPGQGAKGFAYRQ